MEEVYVQAIKDMDSNLEDMEAKIKNINGELERIRNEKKVLLLEFYRKQRDKRRLDVILNLKKQAKLKSFKRKNAGKEQDVDTFGAI